MTLDPRRAAEEATRALSGLVDEYMVAAILKRELMVKLARGEVTVVQSWGELELWAYLAKDKRMGVYNLDPARIEEEASKAASDLGVLGESPLYAELPQPSGSPLSRVDSRIAEAVEAGEAGFVIEDLELTGLGDAAGMARLGYYKAVLLGSNGADYESEKTKFDGYMRIFRGDASGQWGWSSVSYDVAVAKRAIGMASQLAEECSRLPRAKLEPGHHRVLLGPMIVGNFANYIANSASAGGVIFGMSFFVGAKPGDKVASERFTLMDRPRDESLPNFSGFDLEGVATRDKAIIEDGEFKGLLHNSKTAKLMGAETTGNAGWIMPEAFNLEVAPGSLSTDDMLEALGDGYYLTNNWYTRYQNYLEGTFSTVTRDAAFVVKGGKPVACLGERIRIADSMPNLMKGVEDATRETWPIEWWEVRKPTRAPFLLVGKLRLTSAEI